MIPMPFTDTDPQTYLAKMAANYTYALKQAAVPRVVAMSGWAADLIPGENAEDVFTEELKNTSVTILRPASFYSNFYQAMNLIRGKGLLGNNPKLGKIKLAEFAKEFAAVYKQK